MAGAARRVPAGRRHRARPPRRPATDPHLTAFRAAVEALAAADDRRSLERAPARHARRRVAPGRRVGDVAGDAAGSPSCAPTDRAGRAGRRLRLGRGAAPATRRRASPRRRPASRVRCVARPTIPGSSTRRRSTRRRSPPCCATPTSPTAAATDDPFAISLTSAAGAAGPAHLRRGARRPQSSAPCSATWSSATCTSAGSTRPSTTPARCRPCPGEEHLPIRRAPARRAGPAPAVGRQRGPRRRPPGRRQPERRRPHGGRRRAASARRRGRRRRRPAPGRAGAPVRARQPDRGGQHRSTRHRPWARAAARPRLRADAAHRLGVTHRVGILLRPGRRDDGGLGRTGALAARGSRAGARRLAGADARPGDRADRDRCDDAAGELPRAGAAAELGVSASDLVRMAGAGEHGLAELAARAARRRPAPTCCGPCVVLDRPLLRPARAGSLAGRAARPRPRRWTARTLQPPHADAEPGVDVDELDARARGRRSRPCRPCRLDAALADAATRLRDAVVPPAGRSGVGRRRGARRDHRRGLVRRRGPRPRPAAGARLVEADAVEADPSRPPASRQLCSGCGRCSGPASWRCRGSSRPTPPTSWRRATTRRWPARTAGRRDLADPDGAGPRAAGAAGRSRCARRRRSAGPPLALGAGAGAAPAGRRWNALPARPLRGRRRLARAVGRRARRARPGARRAARRRVDRGVPAATETTGIAFRYDPPDAMAPQAILLAVPPVVGEPWTVGTPQPGAARDARPGPPAGRRPRRRSGRVRQYLPATVLAFNADGDAVVDQPEPADPAGED